MTQPDPGPSHRLGAEKTIALLLQERPRTTVELMGVTDCFAMRISDLRRKGYTIRFEQTGPGRQGIYTLESKGDDQ